MRVATDRSRPGGRHVSSRFPVTLNRVQVI